MMNGEYGINDVCLSTLATVGRKGVEGKLMVPLTDDEIVKLRHSADCLKDVIHFNLKDIFMTGGRVFFHCRP